VNAEEKNFVPMTPIRVHFTGDSATLPETKKCPATVEGQPISSNTMPNGVLFPPPEYGRWRGSTRVDPNLVHWKRADEESEGVKEVKHAGDEAQVDGEAPPVYLAGTGEGTWTDDKAEMVEIGSSVTRSSR
jgi:hypothetical protein